MDVRVYQYTTGDRFRLPIAQADTIQELAGIVGVDPAVVRRAYKRVMTGSVKQIRYTFVDIPDEEDG